MCGKAAVSHLSWKDIYSWATALTPPHALPKNPANRVNISPSRLRRKSEPDSMVWETLPVIASREGIDMPEEAVWPFIPFWANGQLPRTKEGKMLSTANARLRTANGPFAPTYMPAWKHQRRVLVVVSWFYEFDSRVHPQIPYAVFPLDTPFWVFAGLAGPFKGPDGASRLSTTIITVDPNEVLKSVGHHRSPAILRNPKEAATWLHGEPAAALELLRPYGNEAMGVEQVDMGIKIPGNEEVELPQVLGSR